MPDTEYLGELGGQKLDYTKEQIKLTRNVKSCTWEIKIVAETGFIFSDKDFARLKNWETKMEEEYGSTEQ